MLTIGRVLKPHGIKGAIKVQSFMDTLDAFFEIQEVSIHGTQYKISYIKKGQKFIVLGLEGIDSIVQAEALKNEFISIKRAYAPKIPEDRYYISDLIGCKVYIGNSLVGELYDILQYGSADIYCVAGEKKFMFPYVGEVISNIDITNKQIILNSQKLQEVAVYED